MECEKMKLKKKLKTPSLKRMTYACFMLNEINEYFLGLVLFTLLLSMRKSRQHEEQARNENCMSILTFHNKPPN